MTAAEAVARIKKVASKPRDTAAVAKKRALERLCGLAQTQLEIAAKAFFDGDFDLAETANSNAGIYLRLLKENTQELAS